MQERETFSELSEKYEVHPKIIAKWNKEFLDRESRRYLKAPAEKQESKDLDKLYAKIGQLEMEREFLIKNLKKLGI